MKQKIFAVLAAAVLLLGMTGCSKEDNPASTDINAQEQSLVGLWWDEYEHADVTEDGMPFSRVLLAVKVNANHTGCIYLGVFDDTSDEPLAVYGGPDNAGFTWSLLADGRIQLGDPVTGETYALARALTRADSNSYGDNMTNVANTSMTATNGNVTVTNGNQTNTLAKADAGKTAEIGNTLSIQAKGHALSASAVGEVVGSDGLAYGLNDKDNLPEGVTAAGVVTYKSGNTGYVVALHNCSSVYNWYQRRSGLGTVTAVAGYTWVLGRMKDYKPALTNQWTTAKEYIAAAGGTPLSKDRYYWADDECDRRSGWMFDD